MYIFINSYFHKLPLSTATDSLLSIIYAAVSEHHKLANPYLTGISDADIANVTLPTGIPVLLELDDNLRPVKPRQLLGDQAKIQAAIKKVEDQGKAIPSV